MKRRNFLKNTTLLTAGLPLLPDLLSAKPNFLENEPAQSDFLDTHTFKSADFGADFKWGVATAAYQIEGAWNEDGKSPSVWDELCHNRPRKIKTREHGDVACDFYHRYESDIALAKELNMKVFRFSTAWSRVLPEGIGKINQKGLDFYQKVVDTCLKNGLEPWITLYHWDIPQILQEKGGWANREVLAWFSEYCELITRTFGDKVKNWMVLNEPAAFTALGYFGGIHAPGKISPKKFPAVVHHATMSMGIGGRIIRKNVPNANIGTTFSCSPVHPKKSDSKRHQRAAERLDILLNRLFVEPVLGLGYPKMDNFRYMERLEKHIKAGDMEQIAFDFDFIGLQNYTQTIAKPSLVPYMRANQVKPARRGVPKDQITDMDWEVSPQGMYDILKKFSAYPKCPPILITENGAAFPDVVQNGQVDDTLRTAYFKTYLAQVLKAKQEGIDIRGYFVWTLLDNFEWAEGYRPRFGLVHVDFKTQVRTIKNSGKWFKDFLQ